MNRGRLVCTAAHARYPSGVAASGAAASGVTVDRLASTWSTLPLAADGTANLTRGGTLRWHPPADWAMASTHDGSGKTYGGTGPYFGQSALRDGGIAYVVRLRWVPLDPGPQPSGSAAAPTLADVRLRRWIKPVAGSPTSRVLIPGWDAANDGDGDGQRGSRTIMKKKADGGNFSIPSTHLHAGAHVGVHHARG